MKRILLVLLCILFAASFLFKGNGYAQDAKKAKINLEDYATRGPNGEKPVDFRKLHLTEEEKNIIRKGNYNAATLMLSQFEFFTAVISGAQSVFDDLNIKIVAKMDAQRDVIKQSDNVQTVMALKPKVIVALSLDPVSSAQAFKPAVEAGVILSFLSNLPKDYKFMVDYWGLVTDDLFGMGKACAEMLADAMGGKGKIGYLFYDQNFYVSNQRDRAFKAVIMANYPNMEIVAEGGVADFSKSNEVVAAMLSTHPEIKGLYVTSDDAMGGALAALREAKRPDIKVVGIDLGLQSAIDMAQGGNVVGIVADYAYNIGVALGLCGAYGIIKKEPPNFVTVNLIKISKNNLLEGWKASLNVDAPKELQEVVKANK